MQSNHNPQANLPNDFLTNQFINFFKQIPKDKIESFVKSNQPLLPLIVEKINAFATYLAKMAIRAYWDKIEYMLTDTNRLINIIISIRPDLKDLFEKPETQRWLYENVKQIYTWLYKFAWGK